MSLNTLSSIFILISLIFVLISFILLTSGNKEKQTQAWALMMTGMSFNIVGCLMEQYWFSLITSIITFFIDYEAYEDAKRELNRDKIGLVEQFLLEIEKWKKNKRR